MDEYKQVALAPHQMTEGEVLTTRSISTSHRLNDKGGDGVGPTRTWHTRICLTAKRTQFSLRMGSSLGRKGYDAFHFDLDKSSAHTC